MRLSNLTEAYASKEGVFKYDSIAKEMWGEKFKEARDEFNVSFDLENDDDVATREIKIDQDYWDHATCKFQCEMRKAGGDWQHSSIYFRCQLVDGYAYGMSKYGDDFFCVIPPKDGGNCHFSQNDDGTWMPPDNDMSKEEEAKIEEPNEKKAWDFLKDHLKDLVDKEIDEVKSGKV